MYRSYTLHRIDLNDIASTERWYVMKHGPEIARRYGPWLERFESFRPVELPPDAAGYGTTNYFCTEGIWRDMPDPADKGALGMTQPPRHARPFGCIVPVQATEDFKGWENAAGDYPILRWVQLLEYPAGVDKEEADRWYTQVFAPAACRQDSLTRFFSFRRAEGGLHLAGHWAQNAQAPAFAGGPEDHCWDRVTEMWFEDFNGWRAFVNAPLPTPDWRQRDTFPFLEEDRNFVSAFLLEFPAYDWLRAYRAFL